VPGHPRRVRFGVQVPGAGGAAGWVAAAQDAEARGFDVLTLPDHLGDQLAPMPALAALAVTTTRIRLGTMVLANDLRHPVLLAREAATVDALSGGRLELGLGAGWDRAEYESLGVPFDAPGTRVARLEEAATMLRPLLAGRASSFSGRFYTVSNDGIGPPPCQPGGIPLPRRTTGRGRRPQARVHN
jgi:probable F420-dependent oxidoreductase